MIDAARIREVLRRYREEMLSAGCLAPAGWRPIETAPKDGSMIIVNGGIAHWHNSNWQSLTGHDWPGRPISWPVTHWQPFPATFPSVSSAPASPSPALHAPTVEALQTIMDALAYARLTFKDHNEPLDRIEKAQAVLRALTSGAEAGDAAPEQVLPIRATQKEISNLKENENGK